MSDILSRINDKLWNLNLNNRNPYTWHLLIIFPDTESGIWVSKIVEQDVTDGEEVERIAEGRGDSVELALIELSVQLKKNE